MMNIDYNQPTLFRDTVVLNDYLKIFVLYYYVVQKWLKIFQKYAHAYDLHKDLITK